MSTVVLYSDVGCPYAHRVRAYLTRLGAPFEDRVAPFGEHPPGLEAHSQTRRIPLLVDGELVLTESGVMLEYLAERSSDPRAWPTSASNRARHRHAAAVFDGFVAPTLFGPLAIDDLDRIGESLDQIQVAVTRAPRADGLLAVQLAPFWLRFGWFGPNPITRLVAERPVLQAWLDTAAAFPWVRTTAPDPRAHSANLEKAIAAGMVHPTAAIAARAG